jgi:16S rRNA (cytosine1402-N4)-methyltransferase
MRMDPSADETAADIVNHAPERELQEIFRRYGEERYARQIARAVLRRRRRESFGRTGELVDVIKAAIPTPARFGEGHPAKRVFQALRIAVNDELGQLEEALPAAVRLLRSRGRIAVISFHSLEDRIVKRFFRAEARGCVCPPDFPVCVCGHDPVLRVLTTRAVRPDAREIALNPRSASARLRVAEKV